MLPAKRNINVIYALDVVSLCRLYGSNFQLDRIFNKLESKKVNNSKLLGPSYGKCVSNIISQSLFPCVYEYVNKNSYD